MVRIKAAKKLRKSRKPKDANIVLLRKVGNSLTLTVPRQLADELSLFPGQQFEVSVDADPTIIRFEEV